METRSFFEVIIDQALALLRIDNFLDKKDIIDDKLGIEHPLADHSSYEPKEFIKLLEKILSNADEDGGLRVYFASRDDDDQNPLTLIYAPTHKEGPQDVYGDVGKYFIVDTDGYQRQLDMDTASAWVKQYKRIILPLLEQSGFHETRMMLYKIDSIKKLLDYIKDHEPIRSTKAHFAAYLHKSDPYIQQFNGDDDNYPNQLTLIFSLRGPKIASDGQNKRKTSQMLIGFGSASGDTGNPCPPPTGACKARGAKLDS